MELSIIALEHYLFLNNKLITYIKDYGEDYV